MTQMIYKPAGAATGHPGYAERSGEVVEATPLDPKRFDFEDVGPMFRIRFSDGVETDAFGDELEAMGEYIEQDVVLRIRIPKGEMRAIPADWDWPTLIYESPDRVQVVDFSEPTTVTMED